MNVKSLLAPWLVRHCVWCFTRFVIGADGQTVFKRQRGKDYVGETACFGEAICSQIPFGIQTKMVPRWGADGEFLGKLDLWDEVIVGSPRDIETIRSFRRVPTEQQWNPETLRMFVVPWNPREDSLPMHLEVFADVTSREHWCKCMARQTVAQHVTEIPKFMCQGVGNDSKTLLIERRHQDNHVQRCNKSLCKLSSYTNNNSNNVRQFHNPLILQHSHPVQATTIRCKSIHDLVVPESHIMSTTLFHFFTSFALLFFSFFHSCCHFLSFKKKLFFNLFLNFFFFSLFSLKRIYLY